MDLLGTVGNCSQEGMTGPPCGQRQMDEEVWCCLMQCCFPDFRFLSPHLQWGNSAGTMTSWASCNLLPSVGHLFPAALP